MKELLGVLIKDLPRYVSAFASSGKAYLALRNRGECLDVAPDGSGYRCNWQWTSELHATRVIPALGQRLMRRAWADHPVGCAEFPGSEGLDSPEVSFIVGHRGTARLPHLLATLTSIAAQKAVAVECVVVEQDLAARLVGLLPKWVRHVHAPPPVADMPYCRSWAFNIGAQRARGGVLVLHDNDMLVPENYAACILERVRAGHEVVNLKRFIFYLREGHADAFLAGRAGVLDQPPESIVQNLEAGGSVAITREGYDRIGGMDESFIGWGGEDNEFWERALSLRVWPYGYLPLWHLWHSTQPGKHDPRYHTDGIYRTLCRIDPEERVRRLQASPGGQLAGPSGRAYASQNYLGVSS